MLDVGKKMIVDIRQWGSTDMTITSIMDFGIIAAGRSVTVYYVINKELFFLSVIKHSIQFEELKFELTIRIYDWGNLTPNVKSCEIGLHHKLEYMVYDVLDKELFFLSVIKYGIEYEEVIWK